MDLPVGEVKERNLLLKETDAARKIGSLSDERFSGYIVVMIEGRSGTEEGALLMLNGNLLGSIFEYLRFDRKVFGDTAMLHFINALKAVHGVIDIISLSRQQIELIIAFNDKIELTKAVLAKDLPKMIPDAYNPKFAENFLGEELSRKESRYDVFKKIGLAEFSRKFQ